MQGTPRVNDKNPLIELPATHLIQVNTWYWTKGLIVEDKASAYMIQKMNFTERHRLLDAWLTLRTPEEVANIEANFIIPGTNLHYQNWMKTYCVVGNSKQRTLMYWQNHLAERIEWEVKKRADHLKKKIEKELQHA